MEAVAAILPGGFCFSPGKLCWLCLASARRFQRSTAMSQDITRRRVVYELPNEDRVIVRNDSEFSGADGQPLRASICIDPRKGTRRGLPPLSWSRVSPTAAPSDARLPLQGHAVQRCRGKN